MDEPKRVAERYDWKYVLMIACLKVVLDYFMFYIILPLKHNSDASLENSCIEFPNLLPLPCMYMSEIIRYIKINIGNLKQNTEVCNHNTHNSTDLHIQCCWSTIFKKNIWIKFPSQVRQLQKKKNCNTLRWSQDPPYCKLHYSIEEYVPSIGKVCPCRRMTCSIWLCRYEKFLTYKLETV